MTSASEEEQLAYAMPVGLAYLASGGRYAVPPHIQLLNEKLLEVADGRCWRLMISMPPRHGKSELASKFFPAWFLGRYPDKRVILCSYEADFAASWGRKVRNTLTDHGQEVFGVRVAQDSSAASRWDIASHAGGMITAGVGGPITGRGADLLIIDDPVKNSEEAESSTIRERTWDWYRSTAYTRLEPGGAVIIIQTRWHEDDLSGRLLREQANGGDQWDEVILPAEAEENDPLGRAPGEALWPDRYPLDRLQEIARTLGSYLYSALFQQRPQPAGGQVFRRDHFRYAHKDGDAYVLRRSTGETHVPISRCWRFQTIDPSGSVKETADYFVIMTFDVTPANELIIVDIVRTRAETTNHERMLDDARTRLSPLYQAVESKTFGLNIYQSFKRKGRAIRELKADADKAFRARPVSIQMENEAVFFLEGIEHLAEFEHELLAFPKGAHDDMVDALAYGGIEVDANGRGGDDIPISDAFVPAAIPSFGRRWSQR